MKILLIIALAFLNTPNFVAMSQTSPFDHQKLQRLLDKTVDGKYIQGVVLSVKQGGAQWTGSAGDMKTEQPYFIASTTKLYVTAVLLMLQEQGKLSFKDTIGQYLSAEIMQGLHTFKGKDYTGDITIRHLMAQTSGIPDYFEGKGENGKSLLQELTAGNDQNWTFREAVNRSKKMKPKFTPGTKGKAQYSDTNYQLLGAIIEKITGEPLHDVLREMIFVPLGLQQTWVYSDPADTRQKDFYCKQNLLHIPKAMASFGVDGGIVSTAQESMVFIEAFFTGKLFPTSLLAPIYQWNKIMFPLQYGIGVMRFKLPAIFSPFKPFPEMIGHSGLCGAFEYYVPAKNLFITGTVNQLHKPGTSYRLMLKVLGIVK